MTLSRTLTTLITASALATGLAVVGIAAPAQATEEYCVRAGGDKVERRASILELDGRIGAFVTIKDTDGAYDVAVNNARLQVLFYGSWVDADGLLGTRTHVDDYDGWHATSDVADGNLVTMNNVTVRAAATMKWRNASGVVKTETWYSKTCKF